MKISCETYIDKIVSHHGGQDEVASNQPIPMRADSESLKKREMSKGSDDPVEAQALEIEMGLSYRQAIGELIFAMTVGRIDISYPIIKLSQQYSAHPSKAHYQALKHIFVHLNATRDHGLTYWRPEPNQNLPYYVDPPRSKYRHQSLFKDSQKSKKPIPSTDTSTQTGAQTDNTDDQS